MQIRPYLKRDLTALHHINIAGEPGVGAVTEAELAEIISMGACCVAIDADDAPCGFLLVLGPGTAYKSPNYKWFEARHQAAKTTFIYVDRIAIAAAAQGLGLGAQLYHAAFAQYANSVDCIACEVNTNPPNPGSVRFHKRLGFIEVGTQEFAPGKKAVVYLERPLSP